MLSWFLFVCLHCFVFVSHHDTKYVGFPCMTPTNSLDLKRMSCNSTQSWCRLQRCTGSVPQDCPHFRCQAQYQVPRLLILLSDLGTKWTGSHTSHPFIFHDLLMVHETLKNILLTITGLLRRTPMHSQRGGTEGKVWKCPLLRSFCLHEAGVWYPPGLDVFVSLRLSDPVIGGFYWGSIAEVRLILDSFLPQMWGWVMLKLQPSKHMVDSSGQQPSPWSCLGVHQVLPTWGFPDTYVYVFVWTQVWFRWV